MAGDWIKMRDDLYDDPAVISIGASTGLDEYGVVGRLHKLWSWADRHSLDGNALSVTRAWIDRYLSCDNFADSLFQAGWLTGVDGALSLPNFDRHNGETAKKRAQTNKRVAQHREKQRECNADSVTGDVTESVTREEKRREEKKETYTSVPDVAFERFWDAWPNTDRKTAKAKCKEKWIKSGLGVKADEIISHVTAMKAVNQSWKQGFEPAPLTYLNQRRWEDGTAHTTPEARFEN